jgi:hypothetical protein
MHIQVHNQGAPYSADRTIDPTAGRREESRLDGAPGTLQSVHRTHASTWSCQRTACMTSGHADRTASRVPSDACWCL